MVVVVMMVTVVVKMTVVVGRQRNGRGGTARVSVRPSCNVRGEGDDGDSGGGGGGEDDGGGGGGGAHGHGPPCVTSGERTLLSAWLKQGRDWLMLQGRAGLVL